jgi:uncharacterized lipoprotein YajG
MKPAVLLLCSMPVLAACAGPDATYVARQDLAHAMAASQPIAVTAEQPGYQTQLLLPQLKHQLTAQGYRLGDDPAAAAWVMSLSVQDQMDSAQKVHTTVRLELFPAASFRSSTRQTAWTASAESDPQTVNTQGALILRALLRPPLPNGEGKLYLSKEPPP